DSEALLAATLARLDAAPPHTAPAPVPSASPGTWPFPAPPALRKLLPASPAQAPWQRLGRALRACRLSTGNPRHEVALHHIRAGGRVARHSHRGEEITVVLQGSFSDALGQYAAGDFMRRDGRDRHAPQAAAHEDCICLTV